MKRILAIAMLLATLASCAPKTSLVWKDGETENKQTIYEMVVVNPPKGTDWTIWFCQFRAPIEMMEDSPASIEHISGTLYRVKPVKDTQGEDMVLRYRSRQIVNQCRAPEGAFLQKFGKNAEPVAIEYVFLPAEDVKSFEFNKVEVGVADMIPQLKSVTAAEGTTECPGEYDVEYVEGKPAGWYSIVLDGSLAVKAADEDGAWFAGITLDNLRRNAGGNVLPNLAIEDWPDLEHRGLMLDISRNYIDKDGIKTVLDILSHYKANVLHLHFGDDEGWRIAIDGLDELTSYGAFRGIPVLGEDGTISEPDALQPSYCGTLDRNDKTSSGNGFLSHTDFVELLKYAKDRHIVVIPEFDTPGHSRAAIKSMEKRAELTGDRTYILSEPDDTSKYISVQDYNDNAINVALPSTYAFVEKVFDGLIAMYAEAEAVLPAIHIGGDEVPDGAWVDSPSCIALMEANGWENTAKLKEYYVSKVADIAKSKGVKIAGWQELVLRLDDETFDKVKDVLYCANHWAVSKGREEIGYQLANKGVKVVVSSSSNTYLDLAYNYGKKERGHSWAGFMDERRCFSLLPYNIYGSVRWDDYGKIKDISAAADGKTRLTAEGKANIIGIQGQLWTETVRNFDQVSYYLFPKMVGLFERGWNSTPEWAETTVSDDPLFTAAFDKFYSIVEAYEMPYYDSIGICYHRN